MEKFNKINSFRGYTKIGLIANIMFVIFIIVTMIYYAYYRRTGNIVVPVEVIAYSIEVGGFLMMLVSVVGYGVKLRFRHFLKVCMAIYFVVEFVIMICDFNLIDVEDFYTPASKILIIGHCVFSAIVVMSYLQLEPNKTCIQIAVTISAVLMMLGTFAIVLGVRVYASVLVNSFAYIILYSLILVFHSREMIDVDCHGDVAKVYEDDGFFED